MFKPLYWLFRVTGLAPDGSPRDKYFTSVALVVILLGMYQSQVNWQHPEEKTLFTNPIMVSLNIFYSNAAMFIASSFLNRGSFSIVTSKSYRSSNRFEAFLLAVFILYSLMRFCNLLIRSQSLIHIVSKFIVDCANDVILVQHMVLVQGLSLQFESLNERIKSFISQTRTNPLSNFTAQLRSTLVEHWDLQDLVAKINSHYTLFYLIYMATKLVHIIDQLYWVLIKTSRGAESSQFIHLFSISIFVMTVILPVSLCQWCSNKAQASVLLAHHLWNVDGSTDMMNEVKVFSLAMRKSPVKFSVGGVFTLNGRFLTKFSVTVLTYLIIAVQLSVNPSTRGASVTTSTLNTTVMG